METTRPAKRLVSKREISIEAYELVDGKLMLEATLLDPYHLIRLSMHINPPSKTIVRADCEFAGYPHSGCPLVTAKAQLLTGPQVERGITKEISQRIGGVDGCVHLKELALEAINFAATSLIGFDEGFGLMSSEFNILDEARRFEISKPLLQDTCHIYK
jgi:hypothetical protein